MNIKDYVYTTPKEERERIAAIAGTTDSYLYMLARGHRRPSSGLALRLEQATDGKLDKMVLLYSPLPPDRKKYRSRKPRVIVADD